MDSDIHVKCLYRFLLPAEMTSRYEAKPAFLTNDWHSSSNRKRAANQPSAMLKLQFYEVELINKWLDF